MTRPAKSVILIVLVIVMGLTSFWGIFAPPFDEVAFIPLQIKTEDGQSLGTFDCTASGREDGVTVFRFKDADAFRQMTARQTGRTIMVIYQDKEVCKGRVPGGMEELEVSSETLPEELKSHLTP